MALKGTIRDFGVADIFQLVGQQKKTGLLHFRNEVDEVRVSFREGAIVWADSSTRPVDMLLGTLFLRAEVISEGQLNEALESHKQTLKRVGTILLDLGYVTKDELTQFTHLQVTETVYALFGWSDGRYEFEGGHIGGAPVGMTPIAIEGVVMNGIRMVDEWPGIYHRLPSYGVTVTVVRALEEAASQRDISENERCVFDLVHSGRTVQKIIDVSRLGEFEASHALCSLISGGYLRVLEPEKRGGVRRGRSFFSLVRRIAAPPLRMTVAGGLSFLGLLFLSRVGAFGSPQKSGVGQVAALQAASIRETLDILTWKMRLFRLRTGRLSPSLKALEEAHFLSSKDRDSLERDGIWIQDGTVFRGRTEVE